MIPLEMDPRRTRSFDDADIEYHVTNGTGPWIVLANGLGARSSVWKHQVAYLEDHYRFLTWDYRGLYGAEPVPIPAGMNPFEAHAKDLQAILRAESIDRPIVVAWSIGMHVMLRALRNGGVQPSHVVLINGTFRPEHGAAASIAKARSRLWESLGHLARPIGAVVHRASRSPELVSWIRRVGLVGPTIDDEALADVVADFVHVQLKPYLQHLSALRVEDSEQMLATLEVPTLVLIGERDPVTPRSVAEPAARRISGAEIFVVRGATHFTALEFPELTNLRMEKFFREHAGWAPAPRHAP